MFEVIIPIISTIIIIIAIVVLYFVVIRGEFNNIKKIDVVQEEEVNDTIRNLKSFMQTTATNFNIRDTSLSNLNNQNSKLTSSVNTLSNQNNILTSSVNTLSSQNNTLSNQLSSSINTLNNQSNSLSSSLNTLNNQTNKSLNTLSNQNNSLYVEVEELTNFLNVNKKTDSLDIPKNINMLGQSLNIAGGLNFANINDPTNPSYSFQLIPSTGEMKINMASSTSQSQINHPVQFGIYQNNKPLSTIDSTGKTNYFGNITMSNNSCFEMGNGAIKDRDAGRMCYQYLAPYDSLDIVGAGTQSGSRKIALHDVVTADAIETKSLTLGNFQFSENISNGTLQVTKLSNGATITLFPLSS